MVRACRYIEILFLSLSLQSFYSANDIVNTGKKIIRIIDQELQIILS